MSDQKLLIPLITPLRNAKNNVFVENQRDSYSSSEYYICTRTLNNLKNTLNSQYDFVIPGMSTGEGDKLDTDLWRSLIETTYQIFPSDKIIPAIIYKEGNRCFEMLEHLKTKKLSSSIFVSLPNDWQIAPFYSKVIKEITKNSIGLWLYLKHDDSRYNNKEVIELIKKNSSVIVGIKDSRSNNNTTEIDELIELISKEGLSVPVFQGWEHLYPQTKNCSGGVFPIANLEPQILRDYTNKTKHIIKDRYNNLDQPDTVIIKLCDKYSKPTNWTSLIKSEFISRKTVLHFDNKDFSAALDKFFKVYSEESLENFHVKNFDVANPYSSICRTLFSDALSFQTMYFKNNKLGKEQSQFLFFPIAITIKKKSGLKGSQYILKKDINLIENNIQQFFRENSESLFTNNYEIENSIFNDYLLNNLNDSNILDCDLPKLDSNLKEFIPKEFENCSQNTLGNKIKNFYISYNSEDGDDAIDVCICICINPNLSAEIPDFVFEFLTRVAIFTKRNKVAIDTIEKQAIKAAISQVMARNMSHNIGSHVLSKFKNTDDVNQYLKSEIAEEISKIPGATSYPEIQINKQYEASKLQLNKNLKGSELVAYFNEYLKNRMDFLADIATTDPTMETSMNFLRDILSGLDRNRILLDRISGVSENINFDFRVRRIVKGKWEEITGESKHDPLVSVPNDILGCQALYIVIENIIRNIVKHSKHEHDLDFVINIDIEDFGKNPNYYKVFIYDNLFSKTKEEITELVRSRNNAFNDTILEKDRGQLRTGNLGTIEMKVCAAYLRKYSLSSIENKLYEIKNSVFTRIDSNTETVSENNQESDFNTDNRNIVTPHLMYAYAQQSEDQSKENLQSLGYSLFFRKPQTLLIIDDSDKLKISDDEKEDLRKDGIWILKQKQGGNHEYNPQTVYNHDFLLWMNKESYTDFVNKSYSSLPKRILSLDILEKDFTIEKEKPQLAINQAWKLYGLHKYQNTPIAVTLLANEERTPTIFPQQKSKSSILTNVAFDYHGEKWERNKEAFAYYDLVCSHHKVYNLKTYLFHNQAAENFQNILSQYAEMVLTKVMIIDERIQHSICGTFSDGDSGKKYSKSGVPIPFTELFKKQNILIPEFFKANLNIPNFGKLSKEKGVLNSDADRIQKYIEDNKNACDFIVLHMGILEKVLPSGSDKSDEAINKLLSELGFNSIDDRKKIVITSGRGKPDNIPEDLCFVSLAILQNAIETLFDKYLLVKLLYSSRKTKDN